MQANRPNLLSTATGDAAVLAAVLDSLPHGALLLDADGRAVTCNAALRSLLAPSGAVEGRRLRELLKNARVDGSRSEDVADTLLAAAPVERRLRLAGGAVVAVTVTPLATDGWLFAVKPADVQAPAPSEPAGEDELTGLLKRRGFSQHLVELLASGRPVAVLCVDLDRFKPINDTLGHAAGDAVLRAVAGRLRRALRSSPRGLDCVARLGGDEFAVVIGDADADAAAALAARLVDLLARTYLIDGHTIHIAGSVGVALAPGDASDPDRLLRFADLALYAAKAAGRGTYRFFEPKMDERLRVRRALEVDLRRALPLRQFQLVYQPQLCLESERIIGVEALLRWHHPRRGVVPPPEFIAIAEDTGLIVPIGEWVLCTACRDAAGWETEVKVAVNLSPVQFGDPQRLVAAVAAALAESGLAPARLELEITESVLLQDSEANIEALRRLHDLGARVAMDDFGTGYSSLSYLHRFPFDRIKVDRSFISGTGERSAMVVSAVAGLGASLGVATTAEGVETEGQLRRIRDEGYTDVQGFLVSRPVRADQIVPLIAAQRGRCT